jgi:dTDP-4-dehydrorhamnose 3,5-epimerase
MRAIEISSLAIGEVKLIRLPRFEDSRGYMFESWNRRTFAASGIDMDFVQDNCSFSRKRGTIRGLHYQAAPWAQAKLVRAVKGSVFDVAVDLRRSSPTFGRFASATLTASGGEQVFVPAGFAHGFCTLEPDTEVAYKISDFYAPEHEAGIAWDDAEIGIDWPLGGMEPVLSDKDMRLPRLADARLDF